MKLCIETNMIFFMLDVNLFLGQNSLDLSPWLPSGPRCMNLWSFARWWHLWMNSLRKDRLTCLKSQLKII